MSRNGKGSIPRPFSVAEPEYGKRWDQTFGPSATKQEDTPEKEKTSALERGQKPKR